VEWREDVRAGVAIAAGTILLVEGVAGEGFDEGRVRSMGFQGDV